MLERFYDPLIGRVTLDGVDIRELNVTSYRNQMALVSQEPVSPAARAGYMMTDHVRRCTLEPSVLMCFSGRTSHSPR